MPGEADEAVGPAARGRVSEGLEDPGPAAGEVFEGCPPLFFNGFQWFLTGFHEVSWPFRMDFSRIGLVSP